MPGPDITRPKSSWAASFLIIPRYAILVAATIALLAQPLAVHAERKSEQLRAGSAQSGFLQSESGQAKSGQAAPATPQPVQPQSAQPQPSTAPAAGASSQQPS